MEEFKDRLQKAMDINDFTQSQLCEITGIPKSAMSQYLSGSFKPKQKRTYAIAKALNVSEAWLMGYDVSPARSEEPSDNFQFDNIIPIKTKKIPLIGEIACGKPIVANHEYEVYVDATTDINADFALKAKGDSMINARIHDGDIVFIRQQPDVENGEIAAVIIDDEATLKRIYKNDNSITLVAENPKYPPLVYTSQDCVNINIIGKAIAFQSDVT